jgi:hypothetical protein
LIWLTSRELKKPELEEVLHQTTVEMKREGTLDSHESATQSHLKERGVIYRSGAALFILCISSALAAGFCIVKIAFPLFNDTVTDVLRNESDLSKYVKAKRAESHEKWALAIDLYRKHREDDPTDKRPILDIARIQEQKLNNPEEAAHTLRSAMENPELEPDHGVAYTLRLVELLHQTKDREGVKRALNHCLAHFSASGLIGSVVAKQREMEVEDFRRT